MSTPAKSWLVFLVCFSPCLFGQPQSPQPGMFTAEEINMTECSFDREAEAVILLDEARADYDEDYRLIIKRRKRIKILNQQGVDRANIIIPFYSRGNFELITHIEARTYNPLDNYSLNFSQLEKKSVFTEKRDNYYSLVKFAMPGARPGSILEFSYESIMKSYGGLDEWMFQNDLPTIRSSFLLQVLPTAEFTYQVQKKNEYPIDIKPMPDQGRIYFEMDNLPALRFEPYMDAARDYVQKVSFQLSGVLNRFGSKLQVNTTWKSLAYDLMTDKEFGSQLDKDLKAGEVKLLAAAEKTPSGKIKAVYNYVRKHFAWNGYDGKYALDGLKTVWDRKKGSAGELNLLMINLLNTAGVDVFPVLVAERDFGKVDTTYPFVDRFNKVVALAYDAQKIFILDATQQNCPFSLIPYPLLNTVGFLVDKKKPGFVRISSSAKAYYNRVRISGSLTKEGVLEAVVPIESIDYAKQLKTDDIKKDRQLFISNYFEKPAEGLTVDSFNIYGLDPDSSILRQELKIKRTYNESGGFIFLNYNMFLGLGKNPFTSSIRFTNINFGYPETTDYEAEIRLPPGAGTDELPENKVLLNQSFGIRLSREIRNQDGIIHIKIIFNQTTTLVTAEHYNALKEFYKEMVDLLNEPVVIKLAD